MQQLNPNPQTHPQDTLLQPTLRREAMGKATMRIGEAVNGETASCMATTLCPSAAAPAQEWAAWQQQVQWAAQTVRRISRVGDVMSRGGEDEGVVLKSGLGGAKGGGVMGGEEEEGAVLKSAGQYGGGREGVTWQYREEKEMAVVLRGDTVEDVGSSHSGGEERIEKGGKERTLLAAFKVDQDASVQKLAGGGQGRKSEAEAVTSKQGRGGTGSGSQGVDRPGPADVMQLADEEMPVGVSSRMGEENACKGGKEVEVEEVKLVGAGVGKEKARLSQASDNMTVREEMLDLVQMNQAGAQGPDGGRHISPGIGVGGGQGFSKGQREGEGVTHPDTDQAVLGDDLPAASREHETGGSLAGRAGPGKRRQGRKATRKKPREDEGQEPDVEGVEGSGKAGKQGGREEGVSEVGKMVLGKEREVLLIPERDVEKENAVCSVNATRDALVPACDAAGREAETGMAEQISGGRYDFVTFVYTFAQIGMSKRAHL